MGKKILVVDDSQTVRRQVGSVLAGAGYEVLEASDGVEGAQAVEANPDIAMVISDVYMPRMSGIEMVALLKKDSRHKDIIVLMLTTEGQPGPMAKAKHAGAKGWIVKPFEPKMLVASVRRLLGEG